MVVSSPEFYTVVPHRPFKSRSGFPIAPQESSLEMTHIIAVVQLPGYDEGQEVHRGQDRDIGAIKTSDADNGHLSQKCNISASSNAFVDERDDAMVQKLGKEGIL